MSKIKCQYKGCSKKAKWDVTCIMGMVPDYVYLNLCNRHKNTPMVVIGMCKL